MVDSGIHLKTTATKNFAASSLLEFLDFYINLRNKGKAAILGEDLTICYYKIYIFAFRNVLNRQSFIHKAFRRFSPRIADGEAAESGRAFAWQSQAILFDSYAFFLHHSKYLSENYEGA